MKYFVLISMIILLASPELRAGDTDEITDWFDFCGGYSYSDYYEHFRHSFDISSDTRYFLDISNFVSKYDRSTGKTVSTRLINDNDMISYPIKVNVSTDDQTYCASFVRMVYSNINYMDLVVNVYDIHTDSLLISVAVDYVSQDWENTDFPIVRNMQADYSSKDRILCVSDYCYDKQHYGGNDYLITDKTRYSEFLLKLSDSTNNLVVDSKLYSTDGGYFIPRKNSTDLLKYAISSNDWGYTTNNSDGYNYFEVNNNSRLSLSDINTGKEHNLFAYSLFSVEKYIGEYMQAKLVRTMAANGERTKLAYATTDSMLYWSDMNPDLTRFDSLRFRSPIHTILISDNGRFMILGNEDLLLFDTETKQILDTVRINGRKKHFLFAFENDKFFYDGFFRLGQYGFIVSRDGERFQYELFDKTAYIDSLYIDKYKAFSKDPIFFEAYSMRNADSIVWDFGDGTASNFNYGSHSYELPGTYDVKYTVYRNGKPKTVVAKSKVVIIDNLNFGFSADLTRGIAPLTVNFQNTSTGEDYKYVWRFGDGDSSAEKNPLHVFKYPGNYSVSLMMISPDNLSDSILKTGYINVTRGDPVGINTLKEYVNFTGRAVISHMSPGGNIITSVSDNTVYKRIHSGGYTSIYCLHKFTDTSSVIEDFESPTTSFFNDFLYEDTCIYYWTADINDQSFDYYRTLLAKINLSEKKRIEIPLNRYFHQDSPLIKRSGRGDIVCVIDGSDSYDLEHYPDYNNKTIGNIYAVYHSYNYTGSEKMPDYMYADYSPGSLNKFIMCDNAPGSTRFVIMDDTLGTVKNKVLKINSDIRLFSTASFDGKPAYAVGRDIDSDCGYLYLINDSCKIISVDSSEGFRIQRIIALENGVFAIVGSKGGYLAVACAGPDGKIRGLNVSSNRAGQLYHAEYEGDGKILVTGYITEGIDKTYVALIKPDFGFVSAPSFDYSEKGLSIEIMPDPVESRPTIGIDGDSGESVIISLSDMLGNRLYESEYRNLSSGSRIVLPVELTPGVYIVNAISSRGVRTAKFVKN